SALSKPCDDSGSRARHASPTASQPSPAVGSRRQVWAAQKPYSAASTEPVLGDAAPSVGKRAARSANRPASLASIAEGRSASVWNATILRSRGSGALYHQPSASASV